MEDYGFTEDPKMVRVDFFKPSGKWYTTVALKFDSFYSHEELLQDTFKRCLKEQYPMMLSCTAICLSPYHEHSHPLMSKGI